MPLAPPLTVEDALARLAGGLDTSQPDQMPIAAPGIFAPPPPRPMAPPPAQGPQGVPWGEILKSAMPFIMAGLAAKQGGRGAAGAMLTGYAVAGEAKRRTDIAALAQQNQALADEDARRENERRYAQGQAEKGATFFRETVQALSGIGDTKQLAAAIETAERVGQSVFGFNPGMFRSLNLTPKSTQDKDIKDARETLAALEKEYGENAKTLPDGTLVSGRPLGEIRTLARLTLTTPEGQAVIVPPVKKPAEVTDAYTRGLARYAQSIGKTLETLTYQDEQYFKEHQPRAGDNQAPPVTESLRADTDALDYAATQYRILGPTGIPTRINEQDRVAIIKRTAQQVKALGQSAVQAIQKQAAFKSDQASLTKMNTMRAAAQAFETKADAQADLVLELSNKVDRSQIPLINSALLAGKREIAGDQATQLLFNALVTFTSEYAKIMEGSTGSAAASTESARRVAADLVPARLNKGALAATVKQMQWEMRQSILGYDSVINSISEHMGAAPVVPATTEAAPSSAQKALLDTVKRPEQGHVATQKLSDGTTWEIRPDGSYRKVG